MTEYEKMKLGLQFLPTEYRSQYANLLEKEYNKDRYFEKRKHELNHKLLKYSIGKPPLLDVYTWQCEPEEFKQAVIALHEYIAKMETVIEEELRNGTANMDKFKICAVLSNILGYLKLQIAPEEWQPTEKVMLEIEYNPYEEGKSTKFRVYTK